MSLNPGSEALYRKRRELGDDHTIAWQYAYGRGVKGADWRASQEQLDAWELDYSAYADHVRELDVQMESDRLAFDAAEAVRMAAATYSVEEDEGGRWCVLDGSRNVLSASTYRDLAEQHARELRTVPRPYWSR